MEAPTRMVDGLEASAGKVLALVTANPIHGVVEPAYDVEAVEDVDGLRCPPAATLMQARHMSRGDELPSLRASSPK